MIPPPLGRMLFGLVILLSVQALPASSVEKREVEENGAPPREAAQLVARFLRAFEDLDMPAFIDCFAEGSTVFFPTPEPPQRFAGKEAIRAHFEEVFAAIRMASPRSEPPFHDLEPEDLELQVIDASAVVATFHLRNAERVARRTLVLSRSHGKWLIAHLHASNVALPRAAPVPSPTTER